MANTKNTRKSVANEVKLTLLAGLDTETYTLEADATNPYAFVVKYEGKTFRVLVKEMD